MAQQVVHLWISKVGRKQKMGHFHFALTAFDEPYAFTQRLCYDVNV
jgi:hypothetical protein